MLRLVLLLLLLLLAAAPAPACVGDCDGNQAVTIEELVVAVEISLGDAGVNRCAAADADGDGRVAIAELVTAVAAGLGECAGIPTPTPTPQGNPECGDRSAAGEEECDDGNRTGGDGCSATCQLEPGGNPCAGIAPAPGSGLASVLVTDAVALPVHITAPRLDPRRLFVVEQAGTIRVIKDGVLLDAPFLDIGERVSCCGERGLLGLAFDPDYERTGRFFVDYTDTGGNTAIARYQVRGDDPDRADPDSELVLLRIDQPFANHNGGQVAFGPDGYLYVGMGDGGSGGDPHDNGQRDDTLLGKLLRLDVDVDELPFYAVPPSNPAAGRGAPLGLIWAKGLRNPWRFAFDRRTGDLYIADVGQGDIEEIDVQPALSFGGQNYGWDIFEGNACFEPDPLPECPSPPTGFTFPVLQYTHREGCSVTGGFVYRGCALPELDGQYFYSDYCTSFVRTFRLLDGSVSEPRDRSGELAPGGGRNLDNVVSFGEDARGELYIADYDGEIYRIVRTED